MNYKFKKHTFGWLTMYISNPTAGLVLKKKYAAGVTPANQSTFNVYTSGKFEVTCEAAEFKQVLGVGDCSLDVAIGGYPTDSISAETPVEFPACRMCLSVTNGGKWSRVRSKVLANDEVALTPEQIALFIPVDGWTGEETPKVYVGTSFITDEEGFVYKLQRES
jgi:hypothetical protein